MFSIYRNSSIQDKGSDVNPRLINRCVDKALDVPILNCFDYEPPFNHLCSQQPHILVENVDVVRREQAFGRWALPKLYRQLYSKDPIIKLQAINSVCDLLHDPEKAFEAIRLKFIPRLANILMEIPNGSYKERILIAFQTLASQALGQEEIVNRPALINGFRDLIKNQDRNVRCKTAAVIEMLSRSFTVCCSLFEEGYIPALLYRLTDDTEIVIYHLQTLEKLFTHPAGQEEALIFDGIGKMVMLLESKKQEIVSLASNCLAMLVSHPEGKIIAVATNLLLKLTELLLLDDRMVYTAAAEVIMFATHTVKAKHQAANIPGLDERLLELAQDFNHPPVQMFAMKALGNMVEHPDVRQRMVKRYMDQLNNITTCDMKELKDYKAILLKLVKWKPWYC